jgi:hypothetical protein
MWKILKTNDKKLEYFLRLHKDQFFAREKGRLLIYGSKIIHDNTENATTVKVQFPISKYAMRDPILQAEKWTPPKLVLRSIISEEKHFNAYYKKAFEPLLDGFTKYYHCTRSVLGPNILGDIGNAELLLAEVDFPKFFYNIRDNKEYQAVLRRQERILIIDDSFLPDSSKIVMTVSF